MIKKTCKIFAVIAIALLFNLINTSKVFANKVEKMETRPIKTVDTSTDDTQVLKQLADEFGCVVDGIDRPGKQMRCDTNITITEQGDGSDGLYKVYIQDGKTELPYTSGQNCYTIKQLQDIFGYSDAEIDKIKDSIEKDGKFKEDINLYISTEYVVEDDRYNVGWLGIYGGKDYLGTATTSADGTSSGGTSSGGTSSGGTSSSGTPYSYTPTPDNQQEIIDNNRSLRQGVRNIFSTVKSILEFVGDAINAIEDFGKDFAHNAVGTLMSKLLDLLIALGDVIQMIANAASWEGLYRTTFLYDAIIANEDLNKIANVGAFSDDGQKKVLVDNKEDEDEEGEGEGEGEETTTSSSSEDDRYTGRRFSKDTEIPVIPVDLYEIAKGTVSLVDINFLTGTEYHKEDSAWTTLRNFVTDFIHIAMYISAAFLITALIFYGLGLVRNSITPQERKDDMEGIKKFAIGVVMLIGVVVVMAVSIFLSDMFFEDTKMENKDEGPIRVNVIDGYSGEGIYSFSTNMTGYARYMAQINNIDLWKEKGYFAIMYFLSALSNLVLVGIMLVRMLVLMFLGIIGPIIVIKYVLNQEEQSISNYKDWAVVYLSIALIQSVLAIIYRIIIENAIP